MDLALNNLQRLICHKTQTNKQSNIFSTTKHTDKVKLYHCIFLCAQILPEMVSKQEKVVQNNK